MKELKTLGCVLTIVVIITILIVAVINYVALAASIPMVWNFIHSPEADPVYLRWPFFIVVPFRIDLFFIYGEGIFGYFLIGFFLITLSLILFFYETGIFFSKVFKKLSHAWGPNPISDFAEMFTITMFVSIISALISHAFGSSPVSPGIEKLPIEVQMYALEFASFHEELITRVLLIGVPVAIYTLFTTRDWKKSVLAIPGGVARKRSMNSIELFFLIISSVIFSLAHVITGGWGLWKIPGTFVAGLVFGYLYIKYGLHFAIMAHFITDYMTISSWFMTNGGPAMFGLLGIFSLITLMWIVVGGIYTVKHTIRLKHKIFGYPEKKYGEEFTPHFHTLKCPVCGSQIFRYLPDGSLICARCGFRVFPSPPPPPWYSEQSGQEYPEYPPPPPPPL